MKLFDADGPLMTALSRFADIVICNLMFVLFSLPVFTIGASLAALYTCTLQFVYEEDKDTGLVFRDFWLAFKRNFKRYENTVLNTLRNAWLLSIAALPWTVLCILLVAAAFYISFVMNPRAVNLFTYLWAVCGFGLSPICRAFSSAKPLRRSALRR